MEQEPIQTEEIEETPGDVDPQTQLDEMAAKLKVAETAIKERAQADKQQAIKEIAETNKATWLDYLLPKLDPDIGLDEITEITQTIIRETNRMHRKPTSIGEASNAGRGTEDKSPQLLLDAAATKARQSGKAEDRSYFSTLKQTLGGK